MPVLLLITAVCAGLASATVWLSLDGSWIGALGMYVFSGNLMIAAVLLHAAYRLRAETAQDG